MLFHAAITPSYFHYADADASAEDIFIFIAAIDYATLISAAAITLSLSLYCRHYATLIRCRFAAS